ncbi:MMPL family transporter [Neptuniibacter sp. CAU 1671]|uniref:efflux RND transporter permease subunit n=1 Tax=Neptuniibacter sp. CAU 1671 TaxID=3032593 RepID=UPI0023DC6291|nr:MMPL family transporter [Neptuniibacter sp. CAU 1671]MDF2181011.1 MMPL family transporter [Neptuniibacter sp. CAU 1671]
MKEQLFRFVLRHPVWVVVISLTLAILSAAGAQFLVFKSDYRVFFSDANPQLTAFEQMQKRYSKSDNVSFIVSPADGQIFTPRTLTALQTLTDEAWQLPYSTRVDSITNFQYTWAEDDDMVVEDLISDPQSLTPDQLAERLQIALNEPLLLNKLISEQAHVSVVNVTIQLPGQNLVVEVPEVVTKAREIQASLMAEYPEINIQLSGMVVMNNSFAEASLHDNATLVPLMFAVVILSMIVLLRTFSGTFATVVIILLSITATMGLAGWAGYYLTGPSATTPIMVLTLVVADCVHILSSVYYDMRQGKSKEDAIYNSLRINFQPVFLTSITTAIGFLSLNFSDSPPFRDLGTMVATGVMLAFVLSVTLFPALLKLLPLRVSVKTDDSLTAMQRLGDWVIRQRRLLLPVTAVMMGGLIFFMPQNEINDDFVKYFDESVPFRQATDYLQENLSGMTYLEISLESGESSGINQPRFLHLMGDLTEWLRQQPEVDHVQSLSDILKRLNKNMHGDDASYYRLPDERELSAQYLLLYEMSLPYGLDLNNQLNVDKSSTRLIVTTHNLTSQELIDLEQRVKDWVTAQDTPYSLQIASPSIMFAHIGQRNVHSMLLGVVFALILISLLLGIALKSVRFGLISLLPNITPAAMGFGVWYLLDGRVGLGLSVVAGMTMGIVVDDTVHFLSKYLRARREHGYNSQEAVAYAFSSVGKALWVTTAVLIAGFMVLAQSTFKVNADMGLLTAITIFIALVVDFLFLPPLLMLLDRSPVKAHSTQPSATSGENNATQQPL